MYYIKEKMRQYCESFLFPRSDVALIVRDFIVVLLFYVVLSWQDFKRDWLLICAIFVALYVVSLFIWWTLFGEGKSPTKDEGLLTRE